MKVLIVNLTRFGDLLQTQPLISGFADQGCDVALVCLEQFASAADLLADVNFVAPFPGSSLLKDLDGNWPQALGSLHAWRKEIRRAFNPELIINLTPTLSARMLAGYLCKKGESNGCAPLQNGTSPKNTIFFGFGVDEFGFMNNSNTWATYLQASSRTRGNSPCNLVDVFRKVCGLGTTWPRYQLRGISEETRIQIEQGLFENAEKAIARFTSKKSKLTGFIGFQLGASDDRRRWPTGFFAKLGDMLWNNFGLIPLLLGSTSERSLGERYAANAQSPFLNLLGVTDLPGLAGVLGLTKMLITNDTGTMHLAAGLNVPVLAIFLATAQAWDTAPYQDGVICLEPDLPDHPRPFDDPCPANCACRTAILPETVFALAKGHLETGNWNYTPNTTAKARVWLTRRAPTTVDPEAFLDLESLSGHEFEQRTFWLRLQRYFLRAHLDNNLVQIAPGLPENLATGLKNMSPDFLNSLSEELSQSGALLHLFSEQGLALSVNPLPILKNRFMSTWQRLQTLWDNSDYFNVLGLLWLAQTQEQGDELGRVLELAKRYTQLCELWKAALFPK